MHRAACLLLEHRSLGTAEGLGMESDWLALHMRRRGPAALLGGSRGIDGRKLRRLVTALGMPRTLAPRVMAVVRDHAQRRMARGVAVPSPATAAV